MRLGVLLDRLGARRGGAEAHTAALLARAVEVDGDAVLATLDGVAPPGCRTIRIRARGPRPGRDARFAARGEAALRDAGCDVVLAVRHTARCDVLILHGGLVGDARAAKDRARGAGAWHRLARRFGDRRHRWFVEVEREALGGAEGPRVIAVSDAQARRIRAVYPNAAQRIVTVPNGVDAERFRREAFIDAGAALRQSHGLTGAVVALFVAHDPWLKGLRTAIEALARSPARDLDPPVHLVAAGAPIPRMLRRLARELGVARRIHEVGVLDDPRAWMATADWLTHPTWYDPMSLVALEALAMSLPVITTPANGVREVMGQRGGIVLEGPGDPDALAVAYGTLHDPALREFTREDARYVALRSRESTRLDQVLAVCRAAVTR